jgi:hypothetical protein
MTGLPIQSHSDQDANRYAANRAKDETNHTLHQIKCHMGSVPRPGALEQRKADKDTKHQADRGAHDQPEDKPDRNQSVPP